MTHIYRKDIDGLRAVAVSIVVAYHAGWNLLRGGFVGVDVFFVISGYLIGSMIIEDVRAGRFSLVGFYERRVRRIFPALAAMLIAASLAAYFFLLPGELESFGRSVVAATFSYSNFFFGRTSGYFGPTASTLPLLHTWSLAIEEQFYVFLPLFVMVVHRFWPARLWLILLAVALLSLGVSVHGALDQDSRAFYMPQARAWELLLGTLLSCGRLPLLKRRSWREGAGFLGLLLIIVPAFAYSQSRGIPGYAVLAPCLGSAILIGLGLSGATMASRALSWGPVVFIGRISYSLYLWHWPIFVFMRMSERFPEGHHQIAVKLLAIGASVAIATLSWKYVETPFRFGPRRPGRKTLFATAGSIAALLATAGLLAGAMQGFPGRFTPQALAIARQQTFVSKSLDYFRAGRCFLDYDNHVSDLEAGGCLRSDPSRPNILLMGDSYAAHLWYGLSVVFPESNWMQATGAGCTPLLDRKFTRVCNELTAFLFADYLAHHKPDLLVVTARWLSSDLPAISRLLDWTKAQGLRVVLIGPIERYDDPFPRLLALSLEAGDPGLVDEHRVDFGTLDEDLRRLAQRTGAGYISLLDILCQGGVCEKFAGSEEPLQFDDGHVTKRGSVLVAERLRAIGAFSKDQAAVN
jgi:peptidoglycan/LPS O-acetylase OafA/YrhL